MSSDQDLVDLADEYIAAGWPVFPVELRNNGAKVEKIPATVNGHLDATLNRRTFHEMLDEARRRRGEDAVIGLGTVPGVAGCIVLDYDTKGGAVGGAVLEHHRALFGEDFDAVSYTSVSGAVNVILRKREDIAVGNHSPWDGVDVRGDRGWIVAPGTETPWGSWSWRSGELADVDLTPPDVWDQLRQAASHESAPASSDEVQGWLRASVAAFNAATDPDDVAERMFRHQRLDELQGWVTGMATVSNRNPWLFDALTWVATIDATELHREDAYAQLAAAWERRMRSDGEESRLRDHESVLQRVVGHWEAHAALEAVEEPVAPREDSEAEKSSFEPIDLTPFLSGEFEPIVPTLLVTDSGTALLYIDRFNEIHGDSGIGKTWVIDYCIAQLLREGRSVVLVDIEDNPMPTVERLRQMSVPDHLIVEHLTFIHPNDDFDLAAVVRLVETVNATEAVHVFIDSLGEAFGLSGVSENNDDEVGPWLRKVVRNIIEFTDAGVTVLDHITKSTEEKAHLHPSGSKRKRAAITGSSWYAHSNDHFDKETGGYITLRCGKDRHGSYKQGVDVATLRMECIRFDDDRVYSTMTLEALDTSKAAAGEATDRPLEESIMDVVEKYGAEGITKNGVRRDLRAAEVKFRNDDSDGALDILVGRGFLDRQKGPNRSTLYVWLRDYTGPMESDEYLANRATLHAEEES